MISWTPFGEGELARKTLSGLLLIGRVNLLSLEESLLWDVLGIKGDFPESSGKISNKTLEATLWKAELLAGKADPSISFLASTAEATSHLCPDRRPCCSLVSFPPALQCCQGGLLGFLPSSQQRDCFEPSWVSQALEASPTLARQITLLALTGERGRGQKGTPCLAQQ